MRFNMLGPLEVVHQDRRLSLGGVTQRATLGYLLLHANKPVATSRLLEALWGGDYPVTARKMLQNAVSGLRRVFRSHQGDGGPVRLVTSPPGYTLHVPEEDVDWFRFQQLVELGRADLAAGNIDAAARLLREALGLWRGPVMADLSEAGMAWPELAAIQGAWLDTLEDRMEAELALGRHYEVVAELTAEAKAEPTRERLCGQLMLALYRCGRQAAALTAYHRTRAALVEGLGLEPGRELRELQSAILNHDRDLMPPTVEAPAAPQVTAAPPPEPAEAPEAPPVPAVAPVAPPRPADDGGTIERKLVSVLLVRAELRERTGPGDPECVNQVLKAVAGTVHQEVERFGGMVHGVIGSVWMAVFGVPRTHEDDAGRALRAALAVQNRLAAITPFDPVAAGLSSAVAVATGEALVTWQAPGDTAPTGVTGIVFDRCQRLLADAAPGEVRACEVTRHAQDATFHYATPPEEDGGWLVSGARRAHAETHQIVPFVERDRELHLLRALLDDVRRRHRPHLVTLVGEPGIGKTRLLFELGLVVGQGPGAMRFLVGRPPAPGSDAPLDALAQIVRSYADVLPTDSPRVAEGKLEHAVRRLAGDRQAAARLLPPLLALAVPRRGRPAPPVARTLAACRRLLEEIAVEGPVAVVLEDLHRADDALLDFVADLAGPGPLPLAVIATARPELRRRRPHWGGGGRDTTVLTLEPLSDAAVRRLLGTLLAPPLTGGQDGPGEALSADADRLVERVGGNPLFALEYARSLRRGTPSPWERSAPALSAVPPSRGGGTAPPAPLPQAVYSVVATRLDGLSPQERAVLQDAAVLGEPITPAAVAALGERDPGEAGRCLAALERGEFLRRVRRPMGEIPVPEAGGLETEYAFRHVLVRDIAYSRVPRTLLAERHRRAVLWLEEREAADPALVAGHRARLDELSGPGRRRSPAGEKAFGPVPGAVGDPVTAGPTRGVLSD